MRVIVELFGRAWMLNFQSGKMVDDDCESSSQEEFDMLPRDPHSVPMAQVERRSDFEDAVGKQRFGFHGSQE